MAQSNETLNASAFSAALSLGVQLACALVNSDKCPTIPSGGIAPDFDQVTWDLLYDLAVIHQLETWERNGFRAHIRAGLPSSQEAAEMTARKSAGTAATADSAEPLIVDELPRHPAWPRPDTVVDTRVERESLLTRFAGFFVAHCAWRSRELLAADVVVEIEDEDAIVNALATFLWRNRHQLSGDKRER